MSIIDCCNVKNQTVNISNDVVLMVFRSKRIGNNFAIILTGVNYSNISMIRPSLDIIIISYTKFANKDSKLKQISHKYSNILTNIPSFIQI